MPPASNGRETKGKKGEGGAWTGYWIHSQPWNKSVDRANYLFHWNHHPWYFVLLYCWYIYILYWPLISSSVDIIFIFIYSTIYLKRLEILDGIIMYHDILIFWQFNFFKENFQVCIINMCNNKCEIYCKTNFYLGQLYFVIYQRGRLIFQPRCIFVENEMQWFAEMKFAMMRLLVLAKISRRE